MAELFLSRLALDPRAVSVRRAIADVALLHRHVMSGFADGAGTSPRAGGAVLWRLDQRADGLELLVQSKTPPDWSRLEGFVAGSPDIREIGAILASLTAGRRLQFRLVANPTRKVDTKSQLDGLRRNGRRVPLRDEEARLTWLTRKAGAAGFTIGDGPAAAASSVVVIDLGVARGHRLPVGGGAGRVVSFGGVRFDGRLTVVDPALLATSVASGIGPGKAYGFGLLSLAPVGPAR